MKTEKPKILYEELANTWLTYKSDYVKESTLANYATIVYNHLIPDFKDLYLQDINHNLL